MIYMTLGDGTNVAFNEMTEAEVSDDVLIGVLDDVTQNNFNIIQNPSWK